MPWPLDEKFRIPANREIVAFIERHPTLSAHSDVAELLTKSAEGCRGAGRYCPDLHAYAYVALYTMERRIFAIAFGMSALVYWLPRGSRRGAIAAGGAICHEIGEDWVDFGHQVVGVDLKAWCHAAYEDALQLERRV